jgi:hypothetical protein
MYSTSTTVQAKEARVNMLNDKRYTGVFTLGLLALHVDFFPFLHLFPLNFLNMRSHIFIFFIS